MEKPMADNNERYLLILTTAGSRDQAEALAKELVERRLAACVNVIHEICSAYRWKGEFTRDTEELLLIKSSERLFPELRKAIRELHSYETPEIIAVPIADGDGDYLSWLGESLSG
jgi:periplasmic divalent cation tolerance protein